MDWVSFGLLLSDHMLLYSGILIASIIFYVSLFRKFYLSVLDPFMFSLLYSVFGFSVVWFLVCTDNINSRYLASYLFTQVAFWAGLFTFRPLKKQQVMAPAKMWLLEDQDILEKSLFIVSSGIYIAAQLLSYKVIGIPLLIGSHIDLYNGSGGWGLLGRLLDIVKSCAIFMLIGFLFKRQSSLFFHVYKYFFLLIVLVFFALAGSKGEFMALGFLVFCFLLLNANRLKAAMMGMRKLEFIIIGAALCFAFFTIMVLPDSENIGYSNTGYFAFRLVSSGDAYFFAYPNGNIEQISGAHPFLALFGDLFSTVRIIPRDQQPQVLGLQLFRMFSDMDVITGPNARQNVFGYVYFGFFGCIIFSYIIGFTLGIVRNKLFYLLRTNIFGQLAFVYLYLNLSAIETDPPMAISNLENVLLIFPFVFIISIFFFLLARKNIPLRQLT